MDFSRLPYPAQRNIAIHIKPAAERAVRAGHPWLFAESIREQSKAGAPGDLAIVFDRKRRFLAVGLYDPDSPLRVRLLQHQTPATIDANFFEQKLQAAAERRAELSQTETTGYRLVHGENDGLPGLIVDRYADTLVIMLYTNAWFPHLRYVLPALDPICSGARWVLRLSRALQERNTHGLHDGQVLRGAPIEQPLRFNENGLTFAADVQHGHKTGFFFDQRDNRYRVRQLAAGKRVLDLFSYNGGFALSAAAGGATHVTSVDVSKPALASAQANFQRNQHLAAVAACDYQTRAADVFKVLKGMNPSFDLVIVDPPSLANSADQVPGALKAYETLVHDAIGVLVSGGVLVAASCSSRVSADAFYQVAHRATSKARVRLNELERTGHAIDHPIGFPEGAYLKCLFATIA